LPGVPSRPCEPFATEPRRRAGERSSPDPGDSRAEATVEVERGADQRQVGQRLGEVPWLLSGAADLLGIQAYVVGVGEHLLEREPRLVEAPGAGERLAVPERARREGAFAPRTPSGLARGSYW